MNGPITTGSLLRHTFSVSATAWVPFLAIAFLVHSPLILVRLYALTTGEILMGGLEILESLVSGLLLAPIASAALIYGVFRGSRGESSTIGECLRVGLGRWLPVVVLSVAVGIATGLSTLACVIPGIIVACGLFAAVPALVVEDLPIFDAFSRSWNLTDYHKVSIFGVHLVLGLIGLAIQVPLALLVMGDLSAFTAAAYSPSYAFLSLVIAVPLAALQSVAAGVTYYDLRVFKEGMDEDELAAVFD